MNREYFVAYFPYVWLRLSSASGMDEPFADFSGGGKRGRRKAQCGNRSEPLE